MTIHHGRYRRTILQHGRPCQSHNHSYEVVCERVDRSLGSCLLLPGESAMESIGSSSNNDKISRLKKTLWVLAYSGKGECRKSHVIIGRRLTFHLPSPFCHAADTHSLDRTRHSCDMVLRPSISPSTYDMVDMRQSCASASCSPVVCSPHRLIQTHSRSACRDDDAACGRLKRAARK